jgi:succinyl-CoA synthetase alpha subunit
MNQPDIVKELEPLFKPKSVAVIGATNNMSKWGYSSFSSLIRRYKGEIYAVNNRDPKILNYKAYPGVTDIPGPVDLAVIVVPSDKVRAVMEDCLAKGVKAAVIISAGFAEVGKAGKALQDEIVAIARKGGIRLVGPNCMGMWSAAVNLPAFMFPIPIQTGPLALISQGGNVGGALVADAIARGLGFQQYVSCGCTADIQIEDYIEYLGYDDAVKVIMVYIEGLKDGHRFISKVREVTRRKPVVALKPGKTEAAVRAISSHSGSFSGMDAIYEAAFNKAGVIRVDSSLELLDVAIGLLTQPRPRGRNVIITTPGGSYGVMCADACSSLGLNVIDLPAPVMETFNTMFPPRWSHGNPVDPAGDRDFIQYLRAPEIVLKQPEVDALIFMGFGSFSSMSSVFATNDGRPKQAPAVSRERMEGIQTMARKFLDILESGDRDGIREYIKGGLIMLFSSVIATKADDLEEFLDSLSQAITTGKMMESSFYPKLRTLLTSLAGGDAGAIQVSTIVELIDPLLDSVIDRWIVRYGKPVITTTFTERTSRISEGGHFPYPNAERAATVLAKLVGYSEYLDRKNSS